MNRHTRFSGLVLLTLAIAGCNKEPLADFPASPEPVLTMPATSNPAKADFKIIQELDYPLIQSKKNHLVLSSTGGNENAELNLSVDGQSLEIAGFEYNERNLYAVKPTLKVITGADGAGYILVFAAGQTNGRDDADYKIHVFSFQNNQLNDIWNEQELNIAPGSIRTGLLSNTFTLDIPSYHLSARMDLRDELPQDFLNNSRMLNLMASQPKEAAKLLNNSNNLTVDHIDKLGVFDYDADGQEEFLMRQCLIYEPTNSYLTSLHVLFEVSDQRLVIKKSYSAIKNTIKGQLLDQFISDGNTAPPYNETLQYWIDNHVVQKEDIERTQSQLATGKQTGIH